jgi:hypothetical protein
MRSRARAYRRRPRRDRAPPVKSRSLYFPIVETTFFD